MATLLPTGVRGQHGLQSVPQCPSLYAVHKIILKPSRNPFLQYINTYRGHTDNFFFIWVPTEEKLRDFNPFINNQYEHLKFTMAHHPFKINFLDILIISINGNLNTSLVDGQKFFITSSIIPFHTLKVYMCQCVASVVQMLIFQKSKHHSKKHIFTKRIQKDAFKCFSKQTQAECQQKTNTKLERH